MRIGGRDLEAAEWPGAAPALLLLHQGLGSVRLWREFPERLAAATGRRVVAFSRYGHGRSAPPPTPRTPSFLHEEARVVLPRVRERLGLDEVVLVGHSDGASIALIHAAEHAVVGTVAMAPHVFVEGCTIEGIRATRERFEHGDLRERMARHHDDPALTFRGWCDVWLDPAFRDWRLRLHGITAPLLLIQGAGDEYGTLAQLDAIERDVRGPVERVVTAGGHSPFFDDQATVLASIAGWLDG